MARPVVVDASQIQSAIDDLESLLNSGVSETTSDGVTTKFDRTGAERRLAELRRKLRRMQGRRVRHPYASPTFGGACS